MKWAYDYLPTPLSSYILKSNAKDILDDDKARKLKLYSAKKTN